MGFVQMWSGNWRARIAALVRARGYADVTALARATPGSSMFEIAALIDENVAASQVTMILMEEGIARGHAFQAYADILARDIRAALPAGWSLPLDEPTLNALGRALSLITADLGDYEEPEAALAARDFLSTGAPAGAPAGWRPSSGDDPIVRRLAERRLLSRLKPS